MNQLEIRKYLNITILLQRLTFYENNVKYVVKRVNMRVVSGNLRGMKLNTIEGDSTRPTRDMVKEALFSILQNDVPNAVFLDLFAGSGAIGIEALSRGAKEAIFIDLNPKCVAVIKENVQKGRLTDCSRIYSTDYKTALKKLSGEKIDIIYIDPPYHQNMGIDAIKKVSEYDILAEEGLIVIETDTDEEVPDVIGRYEKFNYKRYGRNILSMFRRKE